MTTENSNNDQNLSEQTSAEKVQNPRPIQSDMAIAIGAVLVLIILVALFGFLFLSPAPMPIVGQVEVTEIRISGKVPGRVATYLVEEGQRVHKGDTLVKIQTPEVDAKRVQADAATRAAQAQLQKAINGARAETKEGAMAMWQKAKAGLEVAEKSFARVEKLNAEGVISQQKYDEAFAQLQAMRATEAAARSQYNMAIHGARSEDKLAAQALVDRASGAVQEVDSYAGEGALLSPIDGEVGEIFPHVGELIGSGAPIMNIRDEEDKKVIFTIREDQLQGILPGAIVEGEVPALNNTIIRMQIQKVKDRGSYAAWKSAKPGGGIDYRNFEVTAKVMDPNAPALLSGMSVVLKRDHDK